MTIRNAIRSTLTPWTAGCAVCLALVITLWSELTCGQTDAQVLKPQVSERPYGREIRFDIVTNNPQIVWCGDKFLAVDMHGSIGGIRLLNTASGQLQKVTNDTYHASVACSPDGERLFFTDRRSSGRLEVIDVISGKRDDVSAGLPSGYRAIGDAHGRVSDAARYVVGMEPAGKSVKLFQGSISIVQLPPPTKNEYANGIAWAGEDFVYVVINMGATGTKLLEIDATANNYRFVELPATNGYVFKEIEWDQSSRTLYLQGWSDSEYQHAALFRMNPKDSKDVPKIVRRDIDGFKVLPTGTVVYERTTGVDFSNVHEAVIPNEMAARRELIARNVNGDEEILMTVPWMTSSIGQIRVSPRGNKIAIIQRQLDKGSPSSAIVILDLKK